MSWNKIMIRGTRIRARLTVKHIKLSKKILSILRLVNKKTKICVFNLKPKKVIQATKILKNKRGTKLTHNLNNKGRIIASDDDIINIKL